MGKHGSVTADRKWLSFKTCIVQMLFRPLILRRVSIILLTLRDVIIGLYSHNYYCRML